MALTDAERETLASAGQSTDQAIRGRAVAIVLGKQGKDLVEARRLIAASYLSATTPSFHLIPRGTAMLDEARFEEGYEELRQRTGEFNRVTVESLLEVLTDSPASLAPLRMIAGLTVGELAVAVKLVTGVAVSAATLRSYERGVSTPPSSARRSATLSRVAETLVAVIDRRVLDVPLAARESFHSKLDKRDTQEGWSSVAANSTHGVPYSALLYQRYVGGIWRQVQDAYSEVKGDALLEVPIENLLRSEGVPYWRSPTGATGASLTQERYGIELGPDFLIPDDNPSVIIESKVGEDGGTVRDKAARIQRLSAVAAQRGLVLCAVVDGKGWAERPSALANVVIATNGRTFSLATLDYLIDVPEVNAWRGRAEQQ